jgi:hypothetical protein
MGSKVRRYELQRIDDAAWKVDDVGIHKRCVTETLDV